MDIAGSNRHCGFVAMAGFEATADFSSTWGPPLLNTVSTSIPVLFNKHPISLLLCLAPCRSLYIPQMLCCMVQNAADHRTMDQSAYLESPSGFPKAVGKAARSEQQSHSPDAVLASNFGRKLNTDDLAGNRLHASQSCQHMGSSGDTSTSGRQSDSESGNQMPGTSQRRYPQPGVMTARYVAMQILRPYFCQSE